MKDKHVCPNCKSKQRYVMYTWLCPLCDCEQIEEMKTAAMWKEITDMEREETTRRKKE